MNDPASLSVLCSTFAPTTLSAPATINNCNVCGISSSLRCARCGHVFYCSKDHQVADWKVHKTLCASSSSSSSLSWSQGLDAIQAYEWLIDCYRLRVDDDYVQTGSAHGLYNPESTTLDRVQEFAIFCFLAHRRKCIPQSWDWSAFLAHAISLLPYAFEKSDAQQKYGSENVAASLRGVHSLRNQANVIYGYDPQAAMFTTNDDQNMIMMQNIRRLTNRVFQIGNPIIIFSEPPTTISSRSNSTTKPACRLFDDIGGSQSWMKLYLGLHKPTSTAAQPRTPASLPSSDPYELLSYFHNITPPQKSYEWLIDCYRLRLNEDLGLDGKTPMYQDVDDDHHDGTSDECIVEMVEEFTKFCLLVHARNYLPQSWSWDWKTFLTMASTRLSSGFGMDDARGKYGEEGLKYLKYFAHAVYGHAAYVDNDDDDDDDLESSCDDIMIWTDGEVLMAYDSGKPESIFLEPQTSTQLSVSTAVDQPWDVPCRVFDSIGGGHTWFELFTTLKGRQQSS